MRKKLTLTAAAVMILAGLTTVTPSRATEAAAQPRTIDIKVTDAGYEPARLEVKAGETVRLAFHSETASSCQGTVQSKDLGIEPTRLPKGKTTTVEVTPKEAGEYSFACATGMIRGTVLVKGS